jgi:hypothetical protein
MMQGTIPQTYTIADVLKWFEDGELILNPDFQRGPVWLPQARTYFIDSILRGYPIPKLLIRTQVDRDNRRTIRDVVDGQQRLRTIFDFVANRFALGVKARDLKDTRYEDLDDEQKDAFLAYKLTFEQLINADDSDVLEVFVRLNSYAVPVSEAELRNARFENDFADQVKEVVQVSSPLWKLGVISDRERVRMVDQSVIAELFAFLDRGVVDGAEPDITRYYESVKNNSTAELPSVDILLGILDELVPLLAPFKNERLVQRPHFLMLAAALMYARRVLPEGKLDFSDIPIPDQLMNDFDAVQSSLSTLNTALSSDSPGGPLQAFRDARSTTQRLKSRQVRFEHFVRALAGEFVE